MKKKKNIITYIIAFLIITGIISFCTYKGFFEAPNNKENNPRLDLFAKWIKEDPILFDPYFDNTAYQKSVIRYKESMGEFLKIIHGGKISPTDYMDKFGIASIKYQEFQKNPSEKNAENLINAIRNAQQAYDKDVDEIIESFKTLLDTPDGNKRVVFLGGETTTDVKTILEDLAIIKRNSEALKNEVDKREKCLLESESFCVNPSQNFIVPQNREEEREVPNVISKDVLEITQGSELNGPYRINSYCWNNRGYQWIYLNYKCGKDGVCFREHVLADNKYFNTLGSAPSEKRLADMGVMLKPMGTTASYSCNDLTYKPVTNAIDYFFRTYYKKRFFSSIKLFEKNSDIIKKGIEAESDFFDSKFPSEDSLRYLSEYYLYFYSYGKQENILNFNQEEDLLKRAILSKEKMIGMPAAIDNLSMFTERLNQKFSTMNSFPPILYSYVTKSAYSMLFNPFAPSVWRLSEKMHYFDSNQGRNENLNMNNLQFYGFERAKNEFGERNLIDWDKKYREAEKEEF